MAKKVVGFIKLQVPAGKEKGALIPCNIFAGRLVAANGWCKVFVARP